MLAAVVDVQLFVGIRQTDDALRHDFFDLFFILKQHTGVILSTGTERNRDRFQFIALRYHPVLFHAYKADLRELDVVVLYHDIAVHAIGRVAFFAVLLGLEPWKPRSLITEEMLIR